MGKKQVHLNKVCYQRKKCRKFSLRLLKTTKGIKSGKKTWNELIMDQSKSISTISAPNAEAKKAGTTNFCSPEFF
jgi:hypothetical protein